LRDQTVKLFLVVANDDSMDKTGDVASGYADVIVDLPRHEEGWTERPELEGLLMRAQVFSKLQTLLKNPRNLRQTSHNRPLPSQTSNI
jgi:hypothetical protein